MKKYAFAGAGGRATTMFAVPLAKEYGDVAQIVGVFDPNRKRCEALAKRTETEIPLYTDFDTMLEETKPDVVIVATVDRYHHEYIVRALHAGCDVISEKPLTIDDEKCRAIPDTNMLPGGKRKKIILLLSENCCVSQGLSVVLMLLHGCIFLPELGNASGRCANQTTG